MADLPNLFIIGSMKSGTTSLHNYLNAHPAIYMSDNKEPGFFVEEMTLNKGVDWYLSLFEGGAGCRYIGESSTHYTKLPTYSGVPLRIRAFCPSAKLIYVMRDPFDRLVSHYWHNVRKVEHGGEHRGLCKAVRENPEYLAFSHYAMQLKPYIQEFGSEAIYTLTFETMKADPVGEVGKILAWLNLPTCDLSAIAEEAHNQKPEQIVGVSGLGLLNRFRHSRFWDGLSRYTPSALKKLGNKLAERKIDETQAKAEIPVLREMVAEIQREQIEELRHLLGRDFPEWKSAAHGK